MVKAPIPANEAARLKDLQGFEILDTPNEKDYDGLVELISQICQCPIAIVNFLDSNRQWYKATKNLDAKEANREDSFCGHAIMGNDVFMITDATQDERFYDNPDVTGGLRVRFYAGAPIVSSNGYNLGTVCAIDKKPHSLNHSQVTSLKTIAQQVSRLLELRKKNKELIQAANTMVSTQKKVAQMSMTERENENYQTAQVLHEEITNAISAVKNYVNQARNDKEHAQEYLNASVDELNHLTENVMSLSNTLAPVTFDNENYQACIEKIFRDFEKKERMTIHLNFNGQTGILKQDKGLMVCRMIQDLLYYASQSQSPNTGLTIQGNKEFDIIFEFNPKKFILENQKKLFQANMMNRIEMLDGKFENWRFDSGETRFHINIPEAVV